AKHRAANGCTTQATGMGAEVAHRAWTSAAAFAAVGRRGKTDPRYQALAVFRALELERAAVEIHQANRQRQAETPSALYRRPEVPGACKQGRNDCRVDSGACILHCNFDL